MTSTNTSPPSGPLPVIQLTNNIYPPNPEKKEAGGYLSMRWVYYALEGFVHYELMRRGSDHPIYCTTYLTSLAVGTLFGLMRGIKGDASISLDERAVAFSKGSLSQKIVMLAEIGLKGPFALRVLENALDPAIPNPLGNLVAIYWGTTLGADLGRAFVKNMKLKSPASKE